MKSQLKKTPVKGGFVARSALTGRFVSVESDGKVYKVGPKSQATAKTVASRRSLALKRLADR